MKKKEIIELHEKGLTVRAIQKELGISSPSLVQWHISKYRRDGADGTKRVTLGRLLEILPKERKPIQEKNTFDEASSLLSAGWNAYRTELLKVIKEKYD